MEPGMAEETPTRRNKRNSLTRGEDELELPLNKRMQSPVVITGPDGKILTRNRGGERLATFSGRSRLETSRTKRHMPVKQRGESAMDNSSNSITKKPSCMRQPSFATPQTDKVKSVHFQNPVSSFATPGDSPLPVPKTPVGTVEYVATPLPSSKARAPLSARKMKIRAAARLQALDDHEIQASRLVQARLDFSMGRQERAYVAWLNHVLDKPAGSYRTFRLEDKVCNDSSPEGGDFRLIDEVYIIDDRENGFSCVESSLGRSPRSALKPLNGLESRNVGSPTAKRLLNDSFHGNCTPEKSVLGRLESPATTLLHSKRLKMAAEHGFSRHRDLRMQDVCRLPDLSRRLKLHFDPCEREEILTVITQLAKHIDEGRLRMKKGCAILVDVALRKKALYVLLNYNAYWLKIGLHLVIGHTAILKEKVSDDGHKEYLNEEYALLEVFLEKHFFAHPGLSKAYATNKAIDGLYRDGYTEALGRVILKRFFLLVLVLDKAKCRTSLKISEGIDGLDGGSPPLFRSDARVKSSRQVLQEFLLDVMHGEGDVIGNLGNLGYHVYHHQVPLSDYDFAVVDLVEDLQDGVRLCRLVHLLAATNAVILEHVQVPSNGRKRQLHNCHIALESLAQAGVPLEDEEGCGICAEDIVGGNKDKVFPLLWNIMVHLQLPLLVSRPRLCKEIAKLQGTEGGYPLGLNIGTVELLLKWTQVVCFISGNLNIRNFKTSFADGQALCYIANLYVPLFLPQSDVLLPHSHLGLQIDGTPNLRGPLSPAYKKAVAHNFGLVQAVARKLGNVPEVLQLVDLLGDPAMSEKNIIIFVAFLCSRLLDYEPSGIQVRKESELEGSTSYQSPSNDAPALCSYLSRCSLESESPVGFDRSYTVSWPKEEIQRSNRSSPLCNDSFCDVLEISSLAEVEHDETSLRSICKLQACWRGRSLRQKYLRKKRAVQIIQEAWRRFSDGVRIHHVTKIQAHWRGYLLRQTFLRWKEAALIHRECHDRDHAASVIQAYYRAWIQKRKYLETVGTMCKIQAVCWANEARGSFFVQLRAVRIIESAWLDYLVRKRLHYAPFVPLYWHQYTARQSLIRLSTASSLNQSWFKQQFDQCDDAEEEEKMIDVQGWLQDSALQTPDYYIAVIQASWRAHVARQKFLKQRRAAWVIQRHWRNFLACKRRQASVRIQARWRSLKVHRSFISMKSSAVIIQRCYRGFYARRHCERRKQAVVRLQAWYRGLVQRRRYQAVLQAIITVQSGWRVLRDRKRFVALKRAVLKIQAAWRRVQTRRRYLKELRAAAVIQSLYRAYVQGRKIRGQFLKERAAVVVIQKCFRSLQRREATKYELKISKVQACWRAIVERRSFLKQKTAIKLIQTHYRAFRQRRSKNLERIVRIQAVWRGRRFRSKFSLLKQSVIRIQASYRRHQARRQFLKLKTAALLIQASYRAFSQSRFTPISEPTFYGTVRSICVIQAAWRSFNVRRMLAAQRKAAGAIQIAWRRYLTRRRELRSQVAARLIQASWKGSLSRREFLACRAACIRIQAHFRGFAQRIRFRVYTDAVVRCQSLIRGYLVRQRIRQSNVRASSLFPVHNEAHGYASAGQVFSQAEAMEECVLLENAEVSRRSYGGLSSDLHQKATCSVAVVDCSHSTVVSQYERCEEVYAAMIIQASWKGYSVRKRINLQRKEQQTACDGSQAVTCVDDSNLSPSELTAVELSAGCTILRWLVYWRHRSSFIRLKNAVLLIQRNVRGWRCRRKFTDTRKSTVFIQALWRGVLLRKRVCSEDQELQQLRQRILCTAASVQDSDRLGNRLTEALAILLGMKTVTGILSICRTIDVATQHSRNCCDRLAEAGAVAKILHLIQTINRSPPHEQVLKHALATLKNLAHYSHLRVLIAESPGAVSLICEILHMFRNKDEVFSLGIELLKPLCQLPVCLELLQREQSIIRRLQLVAQFLDHKVHVEKRNLERLQPTAGPVQRKLAEKRVTETAGQFSTVMAIIRKVAKLDHRQRRRTAPMSVPPPCASRRTPFNHGRPSLAVRPSNLGLRLPFQDRSNW